jgi:hypothetical protein
MLGAGGRRNEERQERKQKSAVGFHRHLRVKAVNVLGSETDRYPEVTEAAVWLQRYFAASRSMAASAGMTLAAAPGCSRMSASISTAWSRSRRARWLRPVVSKARLRRRKSAAVASPESMRAVVSAMTPA